MENRDQGIVMIDTNVDLAKNNKRTFRYNLEAIELYELIMSKHPHLIPPPTQTPGTTPIREKFWYTCTQRGTRRLCTIHGLLRPSIGMGYYSLRVLSGCFKLYSG